MQKNRILPLMIMCLVLLPSALCREPRRDPGSKRIRILYYGDALGTSPYPTFVIDPLTTVVALTGMSGTPDQIDKRMRILMPRTYQDLLNRYDLLILSDAQVKNFRSEFIFWFRDSVIEDGLGLLMIGGYGSFGGCPFLESDWGETVLQEALCVRCITHGWDMGDQSPSAAGVLEVVDPEDEFMSSLPFDSMGRYGVFHGANIVETKQASRLLANYRKSGGKTYPLIVYGDIGEGSSVAFCSDWTPYGGIDFIRWPYYPDFALNLVSYATGNSVPQDIEMAHRSRELMQDYSGLLQTLHSVMDFVERFGTNIAAAEQLLIEIDTEYEEGKAAYMDADLEAAISHLEAATDDLLVASDRIWKLKDEALLWVYITEWLVVAGTGMICGFVLWSIMIRRKLYREVEVTRPSRLADS